MSEQQEGPNVKALRAKWQELREKGLLDCKVWVVDPQSATLEQLCGEMLSILDAFERRDFVDISHKLK